jgi:outer membrane protein OmpA-like peptidoglycan-associated protein/osmotically-inducible protein OsmY
LLALLGLLLLAVLAYFCFQDKADAIREDLVLKTDTALSAKEFGWAKADIVGDELEMTDIIRLTGVAPSVEAKSEAARVVMSIDGIGGVDNQLTVEDKSVAVDTQESKDENKEEVVDKLPKADETITTEKESEEKSPYKMYIVKNGEGKVFIEGYVESGEDHKKLIEKAYELFGKDNIVDNIKEIKNAPKDWIYITEFALDKLHDVDYGDMNITDTSYVFNAHLPTNDKKLEFLDSIRETMSNPENHYGRYRGDYIVTAPVADAKAPVVATNKEPEVEKKPEVVNETKAKKEEPVKKPEVTALPSCQDALDSVIGTRKINFAYDSADIESDSYALLDDIVDALHSCDLNSLEVLEIDGHTDSIGKASYNKALSQRRAQSVSSYLSSRGFDPNKLKAVGYGESHPIASNLRKSGRAKNRRIEFIVKGVK